MQTGSKSQENYQKYTIKKKTNDSFLGKTSTKLTKFHASHFFMQIKSSFREKLEMKLKVIKKQLKGRSWRAVGIQLSLSEVQHPKFWRRCLLFMGKREEREGKKKERLGYIDHSWLDLPNGDAWRH